MKLQRLLDKYSNKWVALDSEKTRVISSSESLEELFHTLEKTQEKETQVIFVPAADAFLVPYAYYFI